MHIYPDYYKNFRCIADKCRHNCCIGWEIDIDENTLDFYDSVTDDFKNRLKENIEHEGTPHFKLSENERCPFLNSYNLCDIITTLGEDHLCDICKEHPRFHNELPDRIESGLGLCCEEAGRMILGKKEKTNLIKKLNTDDEIIILRDEIISTLQNREKRITQRIDDMLTLCNTRLFDRPLSVWCKILLSLELLDRSWSDILNALIKNENAIDFEKFSEYMSDREYEYEQFCVYLIYRHFANAPDIYEAQKRARFTAFSYYLLYSIGAMIFTLTGEFCFETQVEIARLFSSEIEYSDENLHTLFDTI
ncbi:MAG: flagellin lysine-N-methylase [Ruminococcus sp.]|nr:flagellin lysine-N-methylase [Ruminococcus sp.]